jgi:hypothetical protein
VLLACQNPLAPTQGWVATQLQPPPTLGSGHRVKSLATRPLTYGRAAVAASSEGGGRRRSASSSVRQARGAEPRLAPAQEKPGATTRGGSRPTG